jgi:predicted dehydrogenase
MTDSAKKTLPTMASTSSRRDFIKTAAMGAIGLSAVNTPAIFAQGGVLGANERLGVGFIGVGGRGSSHVGTVMGLINEGKPLKIVAVNDAYGPRRKAAADRTGGKAYTHHTELLADPAVDVVCVATPDRLHIPHAMDAIRAGKDVYCEKPMGHWSQFNEAKEFFLENQKLKRVVQIGNQGNSSSFWLKVKEIIQSGAIGKPQLIQAGFYRYGDWGERMPIPDPNAKPGPDLDWEGFLGDAPKVPFSVERFFSWRMFLDYAGGPCTDLFPHVFTPFVSMLGLKFPSQVATSGGIFKYDDYGREVPDTFNMCLDYPERLSVVMVCTLANDFLTEPVIRGDEGAIEFTNVVWERGCDSVRIIPQDRNKKEQVILGEQPDSTRAHWLNFLDCVETREKPVSDVEFGYHVQTALCMGMEGFLARKMATFDTRKEEIVL